MGRRLTISAGEWERVRWLGTALLLGLGTLLGASCTGPTKCVGEGCPDAGQADAGQDAGAPDAGAGDAGTDGGTDAGWPPGWGPCDPLDFDGGLTRNAGYFPSFGGTPWHGAEVLGDSDGGAAVVGVELWYKGMSANPTFPYSEMLWPTTRAECGVCVTFQRGCNAAGAQCTQAFLGFGGIVYFDEATPDAGGGVFTGTLTTPRVREWDFTADAPTPDGGCYELPNLAFDGRWP